MAEAPVPKSEPAEPADPELNLPASRKGVLRRILVRIAWPILGRQIDFNHQTQDALAQATAQLEGLNAGRLELEEASQRLGATQQRLEDILNTYGRTITEHGEAIELSRERAQARSVEGLGIVRREIGELSLELSQLRATYSMGMASVLPKVAALELALDGRPKADVTKPRSTEPRPDLGPTARQLDAFYAALAEGFRGPEAVVRSRVRAYVDDLERVRSLGPVLDVGCGRGEMLEVLREAEIEGYGIDNNPLCINICRERGLKAELVDAREHLSQLAPGSLGAVTAIHVVEHLALEDLIEFLDLAMAALKPGGLLILETPNPENLVVSSLFFYLDPSHRHPLPPPLLQFIVASRGIVDLEIRRLDRSNELDVPPGIPSPAEDEPWFGDVKRVVDAVNERFSGPADYAVVARRP